MKNFWKSVSLIMIVAAISGAVASFAVINFYAINENALIKGFYLTENAVHVSPHTIRVKMDKGINDFVLVDLRSSEEYEKEHIIGAMNIPAYLDPNTSISLDKDVEQANRIVTDFSELPKDKDIIVYCYSMPCMTGRKVGKLLAENGIYVKHLGIGWNEWRHFWNLWNHEGEWNISVQDYIATGSEPGTPKIITGSAACGISGDFGC